MAEVQEAFMRLIWLALAKPDVLEASTSKAFNRMVYCLDVIGQSTEQEWQSIICQHGQRLLATEKLIGQSQPSNLDVSRIILKNIDDPEQISAYAQCLVSLLEQTQTNTKPEILEAFAFINELISIDKVHQGTFSAAFLEHLYFKQLIPNLNLFFYRCRDPIYML